MKSRLHKEALINVISQLKEYKEVDSIYLFGSCARNQEKFNSDVDLIVFLNIPHEQQYFTLYRQLISIVPTNISLPETDIHVYFNNTNINEFPNMTFFEKMIYKELIPICVNRQNSEFYDNIIKEIRND